MAPFEPLGPRARWRIIYDVLVTKDIGDVATYTELGQALGVDPDGDRQQIQMATQRAAKEFLKVDRHALAAIPNVGYRVVEPEEHMQLAQVQQRKSNLALQRGRDQVTHVDLSGMDTATRELFTAVARSFQLQMEFNRRIDVRQRRTEAALESVSLRTEQTVDEIAAMKERLARMESALDGQEQGG